MQTSIGSSRQRAQRWLVNLVSRRGVDAEFGGDPVDRVLGDLEVYSTVGGEVMRAESMASPTVGVWK